MKKFFLALTAAVGLLTAGAAAAHAEGAIKLYLDSRPLQTDVPPQLMNDVTMVPVRVISEELGAKVSWSDPDRKVTIEKNGLRIAMQIDKPEVQVNSTTERLEKSPVLWKDTTMVPVRFISEKMGLKVVWDGLTNSVSLFNPAPASTQPVSSDTSPTAVPAGATPTPKPADATPKPAVTPKPAGQTAQPAATPAAGGSSASGGGTVAEVTSVKLDGDTVRIQTTGKTAPKPKITTLGNPERIVIDLPNTAPAKTINGKPFAQNAEMAVTNAYVSKMRYALYTDNPSTVRIVVDLKQKIEYNLLESKTPGEVAIALTAKKFVVVLDAGHGGKDSGAVSLKGRLEKDLNLAVVQKIAELLKNIPSIELHLTRSDDTFVELDDRVAIANDLKADLFVSVHANKASSASPNGIETYYSRDGDSADLAEVIQAMLLEATSAKDRSVRKEDLRVTKNTVMPAVLCEIGFLSNEAEEAKLYTDEYQSQVAASIAAAIKAYLHIT